MRQQGTKAINISHKEERHEETQNGVRYFGSLRCASFRLRALLAKTSSIELLEHKCATQGTAKYLLQLVNYQTQTLNYKLSNIVLRNLNYECCTLSRANASSNAR